MSRIDDELNVSDSGTHQDWKFTAAQVIDAMKGQISARTTYNASYNTSSVSPTVYYTALLTDGSVLTSRRTSGVTLTQGLYVYSQAVTGVPEFIAVWDEGTVGDFVREWIVVPR